MQVQYNPNPEDQHGKSYIEFRAAIAEINSMTQEMDSVLLMSHDKEAAARLIREKWDPKMGVALEKGKISLAKWMVGIHSLALY